MTSLLSPHRLAAQSLALAACMATLGWSGVSSAATGEDAHAESSRESILQPGWSVALLAGYSAPLLSEDLSSGLGPGVGLRARYTAPFGLLGGVRLTHYFGTARDPALDHTMGLLELGWAFPAGPLRLELAMGAGLSLSTNSTELCNVSGQCETYHSSGLGLGLNLGASLAYPFHERFFVLGQVEAVAALGPIMDVAGYGGLGVSF
jgi:hypothetical protein